MKHSSVHPQPRIRNGEIVAIPSTMRKSHLKKQPETEQKPPLKLDMEKVCQNTEVFLAYLRYLSKKNPELDSQCCRFVD